MRVELRAEIRDPLRDQAQAASSLLEHFELDVYELEPSLGNGSSHIDAEETGPDPTSKTRDVRVR